MTNTSKNAATLSREITFVALILIILKPRFVLHKFNHTYSSLIPLKPHTGPDFRWSSTPRVE